jgi:hypothetical protein
MNLLACFSEQSDGHKTRTDDHLFSSSVTVLHKQLPFTLFYFYKWYGRNHYDPNFCCIVII